MVFEFIGLVKVAKQEEMFRARSSLHKGFPFLREKISKLIVINYSAE